MKNLFKKASTWLLLPVLLWARTADSAVTLTEDFSTDPSSRGWQILGDTNLFSWNSSASGLDVTWDSSKSNSFFLKKLNNILSRDEAFEVEFRFHLDSLQIGTHTGKDYTFQIACGLVNTESIQQPSYLRGDGSSSVNLVEWNYFADSGFGATVSPVVISHAGTFSPSFTFPLEMTPGQTYKVTLAHDPETGILSSTLFQIAGDPITGTEVSLGSIEPVYLDSFSGDFRVDAVSISSYSDEGQSPPEFAGSVLAQARFYKIQVTHSGPPYTPPIPQPGEGTFGISTTGRAGWTYRLYRSSSPMDWQFTSQSHRSESGPFLLIDPAPPVHHAWYRIEAAYPIPEP